MVLVLLLLIFVLSLIFNIDNTIYIYTTSAQITRMTNFSIGNSENRESVGKEITSLARPAKARTKWLLSEYPNIITNLSCGWRLTNNAITDYTMCGFKSGLLSCELTLTILTICGYQGSSVPVEVSRPS